MNNTPGALQLDTAAPAVRWRMTSWGPFQHAFREFGEFTSRAACSHTVRTNALTNSQTGRQCYACLLALGLLRGTWPAEDPDSQSSRRPQ